jgi:hypothetical protein
MEMSQQNILYNYIKQKNVFFYRKVKQVLSRGWYQWEGGEYKERVKKSECSRNIMYSCVKMENETC